MKRPATPQEPKVKRPATEAPSWRAEDNDVYLRKQLGAKPGMNLADLCEAIATDHGVVIVRNG